MNLKGKKILVTGGRGFIGEHLVFKLKQLNAVVDVYDRKLGDDVANYQKLEKFIKRNYFAVYHLAGISGPAKNDQQEYDFFKINTLASVQLAQLIFKHSPKTKLIVSSTRLEYGIPQYLPVDEKHPTFPTSIYGLSKLSFTQIAIGYFVRWGLDVTILRTSNVYGPHRNIFKGYNVINHFIDLAMKNKAIQIFGHGQQLRDYIYIDDFIEVLVNILSKKTGGEIINIGFGSGISIKSMAKKITQHVGKGEIVLLKWPRNYLLVETGSYITKIDKAKKNLNFQPKISFDEGIRLTINSYLRTFSPQLGMNPESILGGEIFDRQILLGLAKRGLKVDVLLPFGLKHDNHRNLSITSLPIVHFPAFLLNIFVLPYLFILHKKRQFKIIRIHSPRYVGLGCLIFKLLNPKVKLVATYHQFREANFLFLSKTINNLWDHIICDSENVKLKLNKEYSVPFEKITTVHNGVPSYLHPIPKSEQLVKKMNLKDKKVLLYMGLFIERKNPLFLLDVLKKLIEKNRNITLLMIGKGPLEKKLIDYAKEIGVFDQIRLIKPVFDEEKNQIMNLADIFVFPSQDEGFALSPLEAMACGLPVVENNNHSAAEAVTNGQNGYLCKNNDVVDWENKIDKLLFNPELLKKMRGNCLKRVKKEFNWEIAVDRHIEVFKKILT